MDIKGNTASFTLDEAAWIDQSNRLKRSAPNLHTHVQLARLAFVLENGTHPNDFAETLREAYKNNGVFPELIDHLKFIAELAGINRKQKAAKNDGHVIQTEVTEAELRSLRYLAADDYELNTQLILDGDSPEFIARFPEEPASDNPEIRAAEISADSYNYEEKLKHIKVAANIIQAIDRHIPTS